MNDSLQILLCTLFLCGNNHNYFENIGLQLNVLLGTFDIVTFNFFVVVETRVDRQIYC